MTHLTAIKQYLLLGQGDFIQYFVELLSQLDMNKPCSALNHHNILEILQSAIRGSNAQFEIPEVIQRIDVRRVSTNEIGWEGFYLYYSVPSPLDIIITDEVCLFFPICIHVCRCHLLACSLTANSS